MDTIDAKMFAQFLIQQMRKYTHELNAYRAVFENFKILLPPGKAQEWLEMYRNAPEIQAVTERQFSGLDELVEQLGEAHQAKALLELLQKWKPDGEPN